MALKSAPKLLPAPRQISSGKDMNDTASGVSLKYRRGALTIKGGPLGKALGADHRRELVDRLFSLPAVTALLMRPSRLQVTLGLDLGEGSLKEFMTLLGSALQKPRPKLRLVHENWLSEPSAESGVEIYKVESELSFWNIQKLEGNVLLLDHPMLDRDPRYIKPLRVALTSLPGVICLPPRLWSRDKIELKILSLDIDASAILDVLDPVFDTPPEDGSPRFHERSVHRVREEHHDKLVNANVVIAPFADYLFPPLGLVNALLVWFINRVHMEPAWADLRRGRANLHLLYFSLGALTLVTYSFFAAAAMYWLMSFWNRQTRAMRETYEDDFLARYQKHPRRVWIESQSSTVQARLADLPQNAVVVLRAGDYVPADGIVLSGTATVDERWLAGSASPASKGSGTAVYRSTEVLEGSMRIQLHKGEGLETASSASRIADWYENEWLCRGWELPSPSQEYATKAVLPVLLLGLLAAGRGGLHSAKAVIRPDFYSGPEAATELRDLATAFSAANEGIVIYGASSLAPLLDMDCLIIDESVKWVLPPREQFDYSTFASQIKEFGLHEVVYLADKSDHLGHELGCDMVHVGYQTDAKRAFIQHRQAMSEAVAYVGNCISHAELAATADFAVSVNQLPFLTTLPRYPFLLSPDLPKILRLFQLAQQHKLAFTTSTRVALAPNLLAMFSAFYLGTHMEYSVAVTNLGTLVNYMRGASALELSRY